MAKEISPSTHPLTPPLTEEEWLFWLRLLRSYRVGISTFFRMMQEHGSAAAALDALPGVARDAGLTEYSPCSTDTARREMEAGRLAGARLVAIGSADYPPLLAEIPDPPPFLWALGQRDLPARNLAVIGARNASSLGTRMARKLTHDLCLEGFGIVSGLARGIDAAAHLAALDTGTIAVMAGGVDVVYPPENASLAQEIEEKGLRVSEMPPGTRPQARHFPRRNRLVSGLAEAVIVIEAAAKSGSLITAKTALDQGRDVMAVPGHPFDARAAGTNMLIKDGATLVRSAEDVTSNLTVRAEKKPSQTAPSSAPPPRTNTQELHARILDRLGPSPIHDDHLIRDLGAATSEVSAALVELELDGKVIRERGGLISRHA